MHQGGESSHTQTNTGAVQRDTYMLIDYLPTPFDLHQARNLTPIFTLSLFSAQQILLSQSLADGCVLEIGIHFFD